jgi:hypothetical protein
VWGTDFNRRCHLPSTAPLSLRAFHLFFILLSIMGADLFGVWAIRNYRATGDALILTLGIVTLVGGLCLVWYAYKVVRKFDRADIH